MRKTLLVLAAALIAASSAFAADQQYPTRPVTIIVPFAAGGPTDVIARITAEYFSKALGQQFVVENVAGAGGTTGTTRLAQAKPDGYTIMMGHMGTHGAAPGLYANLKYDPSTDFEPLGLVAGTPILIVARKDFPAANLKEFVAKLKDPATKAKQAHAGVGSVSFTTCTLLTSQLKVKNIMAAYRGTGPALNDLDRRAGRLHVRPDRQPRLAGERRRDQGLCDRNAHALARAAGRADHEGSRPARSIEVSAWNALFAPKGTPKEILAKLNETYAKALDDEGDAQAAARVGQRDSGQGRAHAGGAWETRRERSRPLDADPESIRRGRAAITRLGRRSPRQDLREHARRAAVRCQRQGTPAPASPPFLSSRLPLWKRGQSRMASPTRRYSLGLSTSRS